MQAEVAKDLSRSAADFQEIVWPVISDWFGGGELVPVESVTAAGFSKELDMLAGIDAWQIKGNDLIRGIGSRVQWIRDGGKRWDTFSVRRSRISGVKTEYEKRLYAIEHPHAGWLLPALTVQAYLRDTTRELLSVAAIFTPDLIQHIHKGVEGIDYGVRPNADGRSDFYYVDWHILEARGMPIRMYAIDSQERAA